MNVMMVIVNLLVICPNSIVLSRTIAHKSSIEACKQALQQETRRCKDSEEVCALLARCSLRQD